MTIDTAVVGESIRQVIVQQLIDNVNRSPGRAIFTANGSWSVPSGVHKFKVYLAGGGGKGNEYYYNESGGSHPGANGGSSFLTSKLFSGQAIGTSFMITIGAGSNTSAAGGTSTFGTLLQSTGGTMNAWGSHNGEIAHDNQLFLAAPNAGFGQGGAGSADSVYYEGAAGTNGICVIEW